MMFRVGQKVVCIDADFITANPCAKLPGLLPQEGRIYTIRNFEMRRNKTFVRLVEIVNPARPIAGVDEPIEPAFNVDRFRAIVERKTDISELQALLLPNAKILEGV